MERVSINVFVKDQKRATINATQMNSHMRARAREVVSGIETILQRKDKEGDIRFHDWPVPKDDGKMIVQEMTGHYSHLEDPRFDADIAICVVPSIEWADGVVGKLWLRDRKLLHLCLLSAKSLPEYEEYDH